MDAIPTHKEADMHAHKVKEANQREDVMGYPAMKRAVDWYHKEADTLRERAKTLYQKEIKGKDGAERREGCQTSCRQN